MEFHSGDSSPPLTSIHAEQAGQDYGTLISEITELKKKIQAERICNVREKLVQNGKTLHSHIHNVLSTTSRLHSSAQENEERCVPYLRNERALCIFRGFAPGSVDKDYPNSHEVIFSKSARLPYIERIPPYRTWIFLDRNQRMADDQSVVGRRRIYYDESGSETLICSDSEDDLAELEEEKREFSEGEDRILWMAFQEHGFTEEVADIVSQFIGGTTTEIQERYNELKEKFQEECDKKDLERSVFMEKSLSAALDSFDNLFCRRCLVFDCRLHGCSQNLVFPSERQPNCSDLENNEKPCSDQCYLLATKSDEKLREDAAFGSGLQMANASLNGDNSSLTSFEEKASVDGAESMRNGGQENTPATLVATSTMPTSQHENSGKRKIKEQTSALKVDTDNSKHRKEMKISVIDSELNDKHSVDDLAVTTSKDPNCPADLSCHQTGVRGEDEDISEKFIKKKPTIMRGEASSSWKPLEKELFMKGLEIFGKNSCLISRNLLSGLKSCIEVSNYMHNGGPMVSHKSDAMPSSFTEENGKACLDMEQEIPSRSRLFRKRGRGRRLKYSSKSGGHPSSWKRIGDGKNHSCKQYTPCGCQFMCGKQCPCLNDGTCCEKYCVCSKSCKNRFRGCHCAKSQCRSRQCPCFAANRECDPDVCRNCWVSCGDGSLGEPPKRGDGQCGNMRLLLRQQQRILLARSDVAGWGAFIKNSVNKHDYLGEYTGELISHREADKRGKIYDRANSSFLFDLNDQYVLDACRNGDKLKFANHSSKPNCYCKIMLVAGDHRVGIFSKERIEPGEELFYDYRYGPDQAPAWARKPGGSKKDESFPPQVRARKHQSH